MGELLRPPPEDPSIHLIKHAEMLRGLTANYEAGRQLYQTLGQVDNPWKLKDQPFQAGMFLPSGYFKVWVVNPDVSASDPVTQMEAGAIRSMGDYYQYVFDRVINARNKLVGVEASRLKRLRGNAVRGYSMEDGETLEKEEDRQRSKLLRFSHLAQAQLMGFADEALKQGDLEKAMLSYLGITVLRKGNLADQLAAFTKDLMNDPALTQQERIRRQFEFVARFRDKDVLYMLDNPEVRKQIESVVKNGYVRTERKFNEAQKRIVREREIIDSGLPYYGTTFGIGEFDQVA